MKSILFPVLLFLAASVEAQTRAMYAGDSIAIEREPLGSGTPSQGYVTGEEPARHVADGLYHVPNYLPGFPTAATIWPRVIPVDCTRDRQGKVACNGYPVLPETGRGEYLFVQPIERVVPEPAPPKTPPPPPPAIVTHKKPLG
jgi:hypothetical protein